MRLAAASFAFFAVTLLQGCPPPSCVVNADCHQDGQVCVDSGDGETRTCARACAADLRCPAGEACVARDDGSLEGACLAVTGNKQRDDGCTSDRDCATGACSGPTDSATCVDTCDTTAPCPNSDDRCTLDGLRHVCVPPTGDIATGEDCLVPSDCASGTCVLPPESDQPICADNCADDGDCSGDGVACLRLVGGARACLQTLADGVTCQASGECQGGFCIKDIDDNDKQKCASACVDGGCAEGFSCESDLDANAVCMPVLDTRDDGVACTKARECSSGHCAHFDTGTQDLGTLCASPCDADGQCGAPLVCWQDPDPNGTDVCGPAP